MTATIDTYFAARLLSYSGRLDRRNRPSNSPSLVQIFPLFFFGFSFSSSNQKHSRFDFTPKIHRHLFILFLSYSSSLVKTNPPWPLDTAQTPNSQIHWHLFTHSFSLKPKISSVLNMNPITIATSTTTSPPPPNRRLSGHLATPIHLVATN